MLTYYDKSATRNTTTIRTTQSVLFWDTTASRIVGVCIRFEGNRLLCNLCLLQVHSQFLRHIDYTRLHGGEIRKSTFNLQSCEYFTPYI